MLLFIIRREYRTTYAGETKERKGGGGGGGGGGAIQWAATFEPQKDRFKKLTPEQEENAHAKAMALLENAQAMVVQCAPALFSNDSC